MYATRSTGVLFERTGVYRFVGTQCEREYTKDCIFSYYSVDFKNGGGDSTVFFFISGNRI